jgi:hypothetical protein
MIDEISRNPFSRIWVEDVESSPAMMSLKPLPKPICSRISRRKAQETEPKALDMSNLRRIRGCF